MQFPAQSRTLEQFNEEYYLKWNHRTVRRTNIIKHYHSSRIHLGESRLEPSILPPRYWDISPSPLTYLYPPRKSGSKPLAVNGRWLWEADESPVHDPLSTEARRRPRPAGKRKKISSTNFFHPDIFHQAETSACRQAKFGLPCLVVGFLPWSPDCRDISRQSGDFSPGGDLGLPASEKKISSANFFHPDIVKFFTRPDLGLPVKRQSIFSPPYINHSPKLNFFFLHLRDFFYPLKGPENFDENTVFFEKMKVGPRIV